MSHRWLLAGGCSLALLGVAPTASAAVNCPEAYPNGSALRYANGVINYPNGTPFRYANGVLNYPSGVPLRLANGLIQRQNGTVLRAANGRFEADAFASDRDFTVDVPGGGTLHVRVGETPNDDLFTLSIPVRKQDVLRVEIAGKTPPVCTALTTAEVTQSAEQSFTLETDAANVEVHVKSGYSPKAVRKALKRALEALDRD